ncbi:unnamed protein product [marine sediment metagenome]|uniref:Uncharacterized protein n=1 Tax=marine sediment metagenome TaxID=412755 RepID=X0ZNW3_9ZZZZ
MINEGGRGPKAILRNSELENSLLEHVSIDSHTTFFAVTDILKLPIPLIVNILSPNIIFTFFQQTWTPAFPMPYFS